MYNSNNTKSSGLYPGLITYIKSDFNQEDYEDTLLHQQYKLINLVGQDILGYDYLRTHTISRRKGEGDEDYLGYNIVDPNNYGYYSDLVTCSEGYVFSSENNMCI